VTFIPEGQRILAGDEITGMDDRGFRALAWRGTSVDLVEPFLGSCASPGRIGWYRPSPVVSPPANVRCPSGTDPAAMQIVSGFYPLTPQGRIDLLENAIT
jgi:hypothetical protein